MQCRSCIILWLSLVRIRAYQDAGCWGATGRRYYNACCARDGSEYPCLPGESFLQERCCRSACDWVEVASRVNFWAEQNMEAMQLMLGVQPGEARLAEFCCMFPQQPACWDNDFSVEGLPVGYLVCCFEGLQSRLNLDEFPTWMEHEVVKEFAGIPNLEDIDHIVMTDKVKSVELSPNAQNSQQSNKPCKYVVRGGQFSRCKDKESCTLSGANDCSYLHAFDVALAIVNAMKPLPDLDFWVSPSEFDVRDWPMPVLARRRASSAQSLINIPMEWQMHSWQVQKLHNLMDRASESPWSARQGKLIWRGSGTYCVPSCSLGEIPLKSDYVGRSNCWQTSQDEHCLHNYSDWLNSPRGRLVYLSSYVPHLIDAKFVDADTGLVDDESKAWLLEAGLITPEKLELDAQVQWKYVLSMDGTSAPDAFYAQLRSGSVVLLVDGPLQSWLMTGNSAFRPNKHFIPIKHDLSNLVDQILWLQNHDTEAEQIARNAREFVEQHLEYEGVLLYIARVLKEYASKVSKIQS
eukprot:gnl/MRDRNA2_/MRDRNA2_15834_c0_seq1.p1 gnl/MRDRNA2_/MRDRNA2_15834_c0~~gnl/MRDRNA2_/MRDRNA2_15834_c0_seq1.p1  ORF type:complete len:520 (+),score=71.56 gnl/MRDRNA2_/MRDRNA2_15834_c0_seq1:63-1622(+)